MSLNVTEKEGNASGSISRRTVLKSIGLAAAGASLGGAKYFSAAGSADDAPSFEMDEVSTACWIGKQDCTMRANVVNDRVVHLKPDPNDEVIDGLCPKGVGQIADLYDPYRVKQPLKRVGGEKGEVGEFEPISWEQAAEEIGEELGPMLEDDPRRVHFQIGRVKGAEWHMDGWVAALEEEYGEGINVRGHGNVCATGNKMAISRMGAGFSTPEPDFDNTEFFLNWGWNATQAGGPHLCNTTYSKEMAEGYEDGMDVAVLDPQRRGSGQWCDEWLPIEPGTDLAFFLAFNHVLIEEGYVDDWFLRNTTNAPCLVYTEGDNEGELARADDAEDPVESVLWTEGELVYDEEAGEIVPHEETLPEDPQDPSAVGTAALRVDEDLEVNGDTVRPAFELFEEHVADYDPEWAAEITDLPAEQIRRVAETWGEEARIGATTTVEVNGERRQVPYRPVSMSLYHVSQQELGPTAMQAGVMPMFLVGAVETVGSSRTGYQNAPNPAHREHVREQAFDPEEALSWEPDGPDLEGTYFHPDANGAYSRVPDVLNNADEYNLPHDPEDMAVVVCYANPVSGAPNQERSREGYSQYGTVIAVDPEMSDTAAYTADYVLPTTTVDKHENAKDGMSNTHYTSATRTAPIPQLWECRDEGEIFKDLAAELDAGDNYVEQINDAFELEGADAFDSVDEISVEECMDRTPRYGEEFRDAPQSEERPLYERYWVLLSESEHLDEDVHRTEYSPFGLKWQFYLESFQLMGENVRGGFAEEYGDDATEQFPYIQDITGFADWREPTMWTSPAEYEYTLFDYKQIEHKQTRTAQNPLLNELAPKNHIRMNPRDADEIGVSDGDRVVLESHNAVTDETYELEGDVMTLQGIKPGTIAIPYGNDTHSEHPNVEELDEGINPNELFDSTPGYCSWAADQSFHIRVRAEPAGGDGA
ncbi:molybdopterin-containing oxidoreductase family protein [Natrialbaceae archaeon AArc-T1-2]|uniref:molybdopterin-containing oxidoreductase family protein n=1 Tax=Natrialbaceae archaeon AArc-T1-2 TaxID=3053904 RepID=UPI00255AB836|nr:molybdopterin-dependent oxidoreductase [Natrialbaceae archaeon AArc-T1-2]WIV66481.1 molybdopterin-dependent oxidoreductase [Natrialbaceae archaeon AArc-T1-2]